MTTERIFSNLPDRVGTEPPATAGESARPLLVDGLAAGTASDAIAPIEEPDWSEVEALVRESGDDPDDLVAAAALVVGSWRKETS